MTVTVEPPISLFFCAFFSLRWKSTGCVTTWRFLDLQRGSVVPLCGSNIRLKWSYWLNRMRNGRVIFRFMLYWDFLWNLSDFSATGRNPEKERRPSFLFHEWVIPDQSGWKSLMFVQTFPCQYDRIYLFSGGSEIVIVDLLIENLCIFAIAIKIDYWTFYYNSEKCIKKIVHSFRAVVYGKICG